MYDTNPFAEMRKADTPQEMELKKVSNVSKGSSNRGSTTSTPKDLY